MALVSTRGGAPPTSLRDAALRGLAPDRGLYVPEAVPALDPGELDALRGAPLEETAVHVLGTLLDGELDPGDLRAVVRSALDFPLPLVALDEATHVLELFHGPTGSFKDVGARFLARLLSRLRTDADERIVVLVATSGDTGGAVAHAFHGVPGVETVVLYPRGRVSPVQLRQIVGLGGNVRPAAVRGSFDDCQALVKWALADPELRDELSLTTGNSINVGRFLPQAVYYFHAWASLAPQPDRLVVSVPSGNLGNLSAGLLARRMGLPVERFVAATNANDVAVRFLRSGEFEPEPSRETLSSAMDVTRPSNLERLLHLAGGSVEALRAQVAGSAHSDDETLDAIAEIHRRHGYLADPHTAVGWLGLEAGRGTKRYAAGLVLATADPAKFPDVVERATGVRPVREGWEDEGGDDADVPRLEPDREAFRGFLLDGSD